MVKATALRCREAASSSKVKSDTETNIAAFSKAIPAIEKGMMGSFLQTRNANLVRRFAMVEADLLDATRDELLSFLSGTQNQGYKTREVATLQMQIEEEMTRIGLLFVKFSGEQNGREDTT